METWQMIIGAAGIVAAVVLVAILVMTPIRRRSARQTGQLKEGFGPEYARAVDEQGRTSGEKDLLNRQEHAGQFKIRPLSTVESERYDERWTQAQAEFVADPGAALTAADRLVAEVVAARGYAEADFEGNASAISVDHPRAVQEYRAAHELLLRNQRTPVATDELRAAMGQYGAVLAELVGAGAGGKSAADAA